MDIGNLVVQQGILAAAGRGRDTVQQQAANLSLRGVVIAVGVPVDRPVGIGDIGAAPLAFHDPQGGDAVVVGAHVAVQPGQAELFAERSGNGLVGITTGPPGVDGHVGLAAAVVQRRVFCGRQAARVLYLDYQLPDIRRVVRQLAVAPCRVGRPVVRIERAAAAGVRGLLVLAFMGGLSVSWRCLPQDGQSFNRVSGDLSLISVNIGTTPGLRHGF